MVTTCVVHGCSYRHHKGSQTRVFRIPKNYKRRHLWIKAIRREGWTPNSSSRVCGKHFQTGKPNFDENHPDYVPNVFVYTRKKNTAELYEKRKKAIDKRKQRWTQRSEISDTSVSSEEAMKTAAETLVLLAQGHQSQEVRDPDAEALVLLSQGHQSQEVRERAAEALVLLSQEHQSHELREPAAEALVLLSQGHQSEDMMQTEVAEYVREEGEIAVKTNLGNFEELKAKMKTYEEMNRMLLKENLEMKNRIASMDKDMRLLREEKNVLHMTVLELKPTEKILSQLSLLKLYTALPTIEHFYFLVRMIEGDIRGNILSKETQLLMVLMKLKLNLLYVDLAVRFQISKTTVSNVMNKLIPILSRKLGTCICWPKRKYLKKFCPESFKRSEYKDAVCIIDCTEVKVEKPSNYLAQSQLFSSYKNHHTVKFFVAMTPSGAVCFISTTYGGRSSDKEIALNSGFLEKLSPGDLILADRGFGLEQHCIAKGAKLIVPSFKTGKKQLTKQEVMYSKKVSNVRIHVERIIRMLKRFHILQGKLPIKSLPHFNNIVIICAALSNLTKSVIP